MSAEREPLFENLDTIDAGIVGTGGSADAAFESPRTTLQARLSAQSLSDGNARTRATVSFTQALGDRFKQVRLIGWAESLRYRTASTTYFSPSGQLRVDGGAEYTYEFFTPRFRGDRQQRITGGYLIGVDNDGEFYHHPTLRLVFEFGNGLAFECPRRLDPVGGVSGDERLRRAAGGHVSTGLSQTRLSLGRMAAPC